nr:hypothetical protein [Tanacetum cinerariifolium]
IKGRSLETEEETVIEKSTERGSNDTEELVNVLTSLDAASILTSGVQVVSVPLLPKLLLQRKDGSVRYIKEEEVTRAVDVQMAREIKEQLAREDQRMNERIARDVEIARIHAEEEL